MFRILRNPSAASYFFRAAFAVAGLLLGSLTANAQGPRRAGHAVADDESPLFKEYRGIQLGMAADDVRKKLGDPKDKSNEQDFFVFGEAESIQIVYDKAGKVVTISADFLNPGESTPTAKQVFGSDVEVKPDGSMYRMVRYPKAGYWLSFNRTGGTSPLTTVTLQKIQ